MCQCPNTYVHNSNFKQSIIKTVVCVLSNYVTFTFACLCQSKAGPVDDYICGEDVLDIWFDSGASWAAVLEGTCESSSICPVMQIILIC